MHGWRRFTQRTRHLGRIACLLQMIFTIGSLGGCGGSPQRIGDIPVYPARGTVTFEGEPIESAVVTLTPTDPTSKRPASQGLTDEAGEFVLSTYNPGDGAPEGEYHVTVSCDDRSGNNVSREYPELLPARYQIPTQSGLKVKIEEGENEFPPFELVK